MEKIAAKPATASSDGGPTRHEQHARALAEFEMQQAARAARSDVGRGVVLAALFGRHRASSTEQVQDNDWPALLGFVVSTGAPALLVAAWTFSVPLQAAAAVQLLCTLGAARHSLTSICPAVSGPAALAQLRCLGTIAQALSILSPTPMAAQPTQAAAGLEPAGGAAAQPPGAATDAGRAAAPPPGQQHALAMQAFERQQAASWAQSDVTSSLLLAVLFAAASATARWRADGWAAAAAGAAQLALLLVPGLLSALAPRCWYLPRRHWISAGCRLLSLGLYQLAVPLASLMPRQWGSGWMATLKFLACIRLPSLSMMAWAYRMPLPLFAAVHLLGVLEAVRISFATICPAACGEEAEVLLHRLATAAQALTMLSPTPAAAAPSALEHGDACGQLALCRQTSLWLLGCFGYALPLACQWLAYVLARRSFVRRCTHWVL
ncbi:hypothetical protein ABPG75_011279 [Micractinium tetrahymenae]